MRYFRILYFWADTHYRGYGEIILSDENFPSRERILGEIDKQEDANTKAILNIFEFKNKEDCNKYRGKENHD